MTTHVFSNNYHAANGNGVSLADEEFLYVAARVTLSSGDSNAVWATGNYHLINVYGNVVGERSGIWVEGSGNLVRVLAGGQAYGLNDTGVTLYGHSQELFNSGYIYGSFYGAEINSTGQGDGSSIINSGTIEGYNLGIHHGADIAAGGPFDKLTLVNTGTITGLRKGAYSYSSMDGADLVDEIINTGTMNGSIALGDGNDSIDISRGIVVGTIELGADEDIAIGSAKSDSIDGGAGDDFIRGGGGKDRLDGGIGLDTIDYSDKSASVHLTLKEGSGTTVKINGVAEDVIAGFEAVFGGTGADKITGDALANVLLGDRGNDSLKGGAGNDTVGGGAGKDVLTGGLGKDQFLFDTRLGSSNIDTITDFSHRDDVIGLSASFMALTGPFSAAQFRSSSHGHAATTADQRIIYDKSNGTLWYDADGKGSQAAIHFATLANKPADVSYHDFLRVEIA